jgi:uncharacterized membrane protein
LGGTVMPAVCASWLNWVLSAWMFWVACCAELATLLLAWPNLVAAAAMSSAVWTAPLAVLRNDLAGFFD